MEEKKTWAVGAGSGISWLKALLVSYLISVLRSFAAVFPALEIFLEGKLGAGGHCGDLSGIKLFRRKNGRKHGGKTAVSLGHLLWNRVFCHSDHRLRSLPAGRICRSRKTSVGGSSLCRRRNGRRNDGTRQIKADKTEHFFKKQTFKFEKPML